MHFFDVVAYAEDSPNWAPYFCIERVVEDYDDRTKEENCASRSTHSSCEGERRGRVYRSDH